MAMMLLGAGIGVLLTIFANILNSTLIAERWNMATAYAEQRLEIISAQTFNNTLPTAPNPAWVVDGDFQHQTIVEQPLAGFLGIPAGQIRRVTMNVDLAGTRVSIETLITNKNA